MMNELYDLCENLKDEIKELNKKGDISPAELERAYRAVDIIKDIKTIEAMEDAGYSNARGNSYNSYDGQSNRMYSGYYYDEPGMSNARRGRDGDGDGRYSENSSYRRGRDAMGRYTSREGGYSGHEEKEQMMRQIEQMKRKVEQM
jgi:hypothetical protein